METEHNELNRTLGMKDSIQIMRILGNLEQAVRSVDEKVSTGFGRVNGRLDKHDDKLHLLESYKDNATGMMAIVSGGVAFIVGAIGAWINKTMFN